MKTRLKFGIVLALLLVSCSHDEDLPSAGPEAPTDIPVTISVGMDASPSRAGYDNRNLPQDFMLFIKQNPDKDFSTDPAVNCNYNYGAIHIVNENGKWIPKNIGDIPLFWRNRWPNATVIAYSHGHFIEQLEYKFVDGKPQIIKKPALEYPLTFGKARPDEINIGVLVDQTTEENVRKSDFLYMEEKNINPDETYELNIRFRHAFSKLFIKLIPAPSIGENVEFKSVRFDDCTTESTLYEGEMSYNVYGSSLIIGGSDEDSHIDMFKIGHDDSCNWECIMVPQRNISSKKAIIIETTDGRIFKYGIANDILLESGFSYTMTLTVGGEPSRSSTSDYRLTSEPWNVDSSALKGQ